VWNLTLAASVSPEVTAAIGLVTAVVGAAAGHWFGAWREQRNMGWQARDAWLREIRGVLDDAARAVAEAAYAFDRRRTATDADRDELGAKAYLRLMEAEVAGNRISTRLGTDSEASKRWQEVLPPLRQLSELAYKQGREREHSAAERTRWMTARNEVTKTRDAFFIAAEVWLDEREWQLPGRPRLSADDRRRASSRAIEQHGDTDQNADSNARAHFDD
jgi:hypothetical protein